MKRIVIGFVLSALAVSVGHDELWARGGGRAGGGGGGGRVGGGGGGFSGGGMSRPSPSIGRSPSIGGGGMSRPSPNLPRPAGGFGGDAGRPNLGGGPGGIGGGGQIGRPGAGGAIGGGRPNAGQLNDFLGIPRPSTGAIGAGAAGRPGIGGGPAAGSRGGAAADFLQQSGPGAGQLPANRPDFGQPGRPDLGQPGRPDIGGGQIRDNISDNRAGRIDNRQQWQDNRQQRRDQVWDQIEDNYPRLDFWTDHPNWAAWRLNRPYRWATWGALTGWFGYSGGSEPYYYDYGTTTYYQDGQVYQDGQAVATADQYADQAASIAAAGDTADPANSEWMPLGVFALTQDGQSVGATPTLFLQLAVDKQAVLSGTFKNMATGHSQTIEGAVDKNSQRAAWGIVGQQRPIMETGLANLTKDEAPALIHFADGQTQQWLMVRLKDPEQAQ